jgi:hypothetical protein
MTTWKNFVKPGRSQMKISAGAQCMLDTQRYKHAHTQNMYHLLTSHCNSVCTKAPQRHVIRTSSVLLWNMKYMLLEYIYKNAQSGQRIWQQENNTWSCTFKGKRLTTRPTYPFECNDTEVYTDLNTAALKLHCC